MRVKTLLTISMCLCFSTWAETPEGFLPSSQDVVVIDGVAIRKGTVAASLQNILLFDSLHETDPQAAAKIIEDQRPLVPALRAVGLFQLFPLDQWLLSENKGRNLVGLLYLQLFPNECSNQGLETVKAMSLEGPDMLRPIALETLNRISAP